MSDERPQGSRRCFAGFEAAAMIIAVALVAGCGGSAHGVSTQTASTASASPSSSEPPTPTTDLRSEILDQYRGFWTHLTPASRAPAADRRGILTPFTSDPELTSLLRGIASDRARGRVFYGQPTIRARLTQLAEVSGIAVVSDCQDASKTGDRDVASGRLLTKGSPRTLVVSTMHRSSDGKWRVSFVTFPRHSC